MNFTKMHGLGNDYLYLFVDELPHNIEELSRKYSDRHFGAGSDGIICILPSVKADFEMRIFNADGSEAKMCGNGIRCVGKYVFDRGHTNKTELTIDTLSGIKTLSLALEEGRVSSVAVSMGHVTVEPARNVSIVSTYAFDSEKRSFVSVQKAEQQLSVFSVDMGNPHAVIFVSDAEAAPVAEVGSLVEQAPAFEGGVNVEFVQVISPTELRMRVWERGSGITMACGTGACASVAAAVAANYANTNTDVTVHLDGGDLSICVDSHNNVSMSGPAAFVYDGTTLD